MNTQLLEEVRQHILKDPKSFNMIDYMIPQKDVKATLGYDHCGTVGCICGWAARLVQVKRKKSLSSLGLYQPFSGRFSEYYGDEPIVATKFLKISEEEGEHLFHEERWPDKYKLAYTRATTPAKRARVAANLLKEVIKRKRVWWAPPISE